MTKEWIVQGRYPEHGVTTWEDENAELNEKDGNRSLREYRENGPGEYRLIARNVKDNRKA